MLYRGAYQWSKFSPILSVKEFFISSLISSKQLFFVSGIISPQVLRCFLKPTTSLLFSLFISQQIRPILYGRMLSNSFDVEDVVFFFVTFSPFYLLFRRHYDVAHFDQSSHFVKDHVVSFFLSIQPECRVLHSSSLILWSFTSLLNRSAVWNLSYPLCHSFNSSGGSVLLISSSILSSCQVHVQFIPFPAGVLSKLYHSYSFSILF